MYVNKCTKCGAEFETKNPKRIICPNCLYPDRKPLLETGSSVVEEVDKVVSQPEQELQERPQMRSSYSYEGDPEQQRPYPPRNNYNRPQGGNNYQRNNGGYNRQGGRPNNRQGGYNNNRGKGNKRFPNKRNQGGRRNRELLVTKEQLALIETLYKHMLPLPNTDAHEVIGSQINLEPKKVFFGINLVRQKMFLPKLPYPKRKLAVSADQLMAIKNLYEPLLPLPPIGCHKIIAAQLRMDEWRVHVGIGLIRKQMGLDRWNEGRADAPEQIIRPRKGLSPNDRYPKEDAVSETEDGNKE